MRLEQKRYHFAYQDGKLADVKNAYLSLTEKLDPEKRMELEKTFTSINVSFENQIKGYSIIEHLLENSVRIFDNENNEIFLVKKEIPLIQWDDESIDDEEVLEVLNVLKEISPVANTEESSVDNGENSTETKPPVETPFVYGDAFMAAKKKLENVGYNLAEFSIEDTETNPEINSGQGSSRTGVGYFYKKGSGRKIIIDKGESIEVLNNVSEFNLGDTVVKITGDYEQFSYSTFAKTSADKEV